MSASTTRRPHARLDRVARSSAQLFSAGSDQPLRQERLRLSLLTGSYHIRANTTSSNWFGYNQGALEQGGTLFNSISGDWTVPTVTQHGQDENSSDWIGIGGGCVDSAAPSATRR